MGLYEVVFDNIWRSVVLTTVLGYVGAKIVEYMPLVVALQYIPKEKKVEKWEKDLVYLYHWHHSWTRQVPNLSPYSIKLETWLRLKKIKYQIVETARFSKTTKQIPYIMLNGVEVAESNNIITFLSDYFGIDETDGLKGEQFGVARAMMKMIEDSTAWTIFMDRYIYKPELYMRVFRMAEPKFLYTKLQGVITKQFGKRSTVHGIGRQSREVVEAFAKADLKALSEYLGDKQFLMGDNISLVDCAVFGHLCQVAFVDFPYFHKAALSVNVQDYLGRIRARMWPDWHQRVNLAVFES